MWIARDKNGELYLFTEKPTLDSDGCWACDSEISFGLFKDQEELNGWYHYVEINGDYYREVTFENSPKELVIKNED